MQALLLEKKGVDIRAIRTVFLPMYVYVFFQDYLLRGGMPTCAKLKKPNNTMQNKYF